MRFLFGLVVTSYLFAQTDGITTSAAKVVVLQPDEARFGVDVTAPFASTLEQVLQALNGTGIQASDLVGQRISNTPSSTVFSFAFVRPADTFKILSTKLQALQRTPPTGLNVQYGSALGASSGILDEMRRTLLPGLIADARRKAQTSANAANLMLGAIRSITDYGADSLSFLYLSSASPQSEFRVTYSVTVRFAVQ